MSTLQPTDTKDTYGPQTDEVTFLLEELLPTLTPTQAAQIEGWYPVDFAHLPASVRTHVESVDLGNERRNLAAARGLASNAVYAVAAEIPELDKVPATWQAAAAAAENAALALVLRDVLDRDVYRLLTGPIAAVFGPLHPDDLADEEGS